MAANSVVLVLGAGPRVGASVAENFASKGYKVALASRKGTGAKTAEGYFSIQADFAKPESIPAVFDATKAAFNAFPSVVIYNAGSLTPPPDQDSVFSIPIASVSSDLAINTISAYAAAQQAVKGWATLPKDTKKTFIFTGNATNVSIVPMPMMMNAGMGKSATSYWIGMADTLFSSKGYR
jgi:NAD(P)-dependent dehydrogenase (short-subunit alcohol dehydrogenase family)